MRLSAASDPPAAAQRRTLLVALGLALATLALFCQVGRFEFINFDDPQYVSRNTHVQQGLTGESIAWAFSLNETDNWNPLTWLSHMATVEFFGKGPAAPHLVNLALHAANSALLFLVLRSLTGALW